MSSSNPEKNKAIVLEAFDTLFNKRDYVTATEGRRNGIRFRTTILQSGKTATGIQIPDDVIAKLGTSKKPAVRVTINGYTYRSTVAVMGGKFMVGVNAENREKVKVAGGDTVDVEVALDTEPREVRCRLTSQRC